MNRPAPSLRSPALHVAAWVFVVGGVVAAGVLLARTVAGLAGGGPVPVVVPVLAGAALLAVLVILAIWRRHLFLDADLARLVTAHHGEVDRQGRTLFAARVGGVRLRAQLDHPLASYSPLWRLDRRLRPSRRSGAAGPPTWTGSVVELDVPLAAERLPSLPVTWRPATGPSPAELSEDLREAVRRAAPALLSDDGVRLDLGPDGARVTVEGGSWMGGMFAARIERALAFAEALDDGSHGVDGGVAPRPGGRGGGTTTAGSGSRVGSIPFLLLPAVRIALISVLLPLLAPAPGAADSISEGAAYLVATQAADGSWSSPQVRPVHATTQALRALGTALSDAPARTAAADWLAGSEAADNDALARRTEALAPEGRDVSAEVSELIAGADRRGGWGLTAEFSADPLDTALALGALAGRPEPAADLLQGGLSSLLSAQQSDGGWACVPDGDSEIFCTAQAFLALAGYRTLFFVEPALDSAAGYLLSQLGADGRIGPADGGVGIRTALAALALSARLEPELPVQLVIAFLEGRQQADGGWGDDPYETALAMRALTALAALPFCGDGGVNLPGEECDGLDLGGATCGGLGLGEGTVACTSTCTLDTSGCSGPPVCGDDLINQASEACDGTDLGGQTCEGLGLGAGTLACAGSCTFDTSDCSAPPVCGDGVVNQPVESCDGADLGGATCSDLGFLGGTLGCNADCTYDAGGCEGVPFCGDGVINTPDEECDGPDLGGATCEGLGLGGGALTCRSDCTFRTSLCLDSGAVQPREVVLEPASPVCAGGSDAVPMTLTFPPDSTVSEVDIFLLFDDTGSFASRVPAVRSIFTQLVSQLQAGLPDISFAFGVGRFEDYGGPATGWSREFSSGRPFVLNQPMVTPEVAGFLDLISAALNRRAPGFGGDGPETNVEALWQIATGAGFDGNGNGSTLDSGAAGAVGTQGSPGSSGDVPEFASNVAATSGTLGGVGFRPGALHLVIMAGDICSVSPFTAGTPIPNVLTGAGGASVATSAFRCSGSARFGFVSDSVSRSFNTIPGAVAPLGSATVPGTIGALNDLGISVIGLAPGGVAIRNPVGPTNSPSVVQSAIALLTGAVDDTGNPLVFNISGGAGPIRDAILSAVNTAVTRPADVSLIPVGLPAGLTAEVEPDVVPGVGPGESAQFTVTFTGDGSPVSGDFALRFSDQVTNATLVTVPGRAECLPIVGVPDDDDDDGFADDEDCDDNDPEVNPGADEVPGNGKDDDCNPATPDEPPPTALVCRLTADKLQYQATDLVHLDLVLENVSSDFSLSGLEVRLSSGLSAGPLAAVEQLDIPALAPGSRTDLSFVLPASERTAGEHTAVADVLQGTALATTCSTAFVIESSDSTGQGLLGNLTISPRVITAGEETTASYQVDNLGNAALVDTELRVLLVDPDDLQVLVELSETVTLPVGGSVSNEGGLLTDGLLPGPYLAVLVAELAGTGTRVTLDTDGLTVVNTPPDCTGATATPAELWPPDHKMVPVTLGGVTDADGDELSLIVTGIWQDEPTDETGDGAFCGDATGTGTATPVVRAERSGTGDGRVYHVHFLADDGVGGTCEAVATVCVPRDRGRGSECFDQGALYDSTICP